MAKAKSINDFIRKELEQNIDADASIIVGKLANKGLNCNVQNVYRIRNLMRKDRSARAYNAHETRKGNKMTLTKHIVNVLSDHPEGLSDRDIAIAVKHIGYASRATDFLGVVRKKLYDMVATGDIAKNGLNYKLLEIALENIEKQVAQTIGPVQTEPLISNSNSDYELLRESLVDYAKAKGFVSPETFPDNLISQRRSLVKATIAYSNLFNSGIIENADE